MPAREHAPPVHYISRLASVTSDTKRTVGFASFKAWVRRLSYSRQRWTTIPFNPGPTDFVFLFRHRHQSAVISRIYACKSAHDEVVLSSACCNLDVQAGLQRRRLPPNPSGTLSQLRVRDGRCTPQSPLTFSHFPRAQNKPLRRLALLAQRTMT